MLLSFALIIICSIGLGGILKRLKLPPLLGMLIVGIILGPYVLNLVSPELLSISTDIRQIALTIILLRAGLALDITMLKKVGRSALLMCFLPAIFEMVAIVIFAPLLFGISHLEAAIMGAVLGSVSPAIVVPKMIELVEKGRGTEKGIPQLLMAGATVNAVFVVVLFSSFMSTYQTGAYDFISIIKIPLNIILGLALGIAAGFFLTWVFKKLKPHATVKTLILLAVAVLFVVLENSALSFLPISGLLSVAALGCTILKRNAKLSVEISNKLNKIWVFAEILLFTLVGTTIDPRFAVQSFGLATALLAIMLAFRLLGVWLCLLKTQLSFKERLFCTIAYLPKATVQAAIGALPLAMNVSAGAIILAVAILSILITAPLGAFGIDLASKHLLPISSLTTS